MSVSDKDLEAIAAGFAPVVRSSISAAERRMNDRINSAVRQKRGSDADVEELADVIIATVKGAIAPLKERLERLEQGMGHSGASVLTRSVESSAAIVKPRIITKSAARPVVYHGRSLEGANEWHEGRRYHKGDYVKRAGVVYFCRKDTSTKPGFDWSAWTRASRPVRLAARA